MTDESTPDKPALRVRPYLLTGGRTKTDVDIPLEAQVRTSDIGRDATTQSPEKAAIIELCEKPHSLAEISALVGVHLQVARILVGDLVTDGHVSTNTASSDSNERPDVRLLERVLDGLQAL